MNQPGEINQGADVAVFQIPYSAHAVPNVLDLVPRCLISGRSLRASDQGCLDLLPPFQQVSIERFGSYSCCEIKMEQTLNER